MPSSLWHKGLLHPRNLFIVPKLIVEPPTFWHVRTAGTSNGFSSRNSGWRNKISSYFRVGSKTVLGTIRDVSVCRLAIRMRKLPHPPWFKSLCKHILCKRCIILRAFISGIYLKTCVLLSASMKCNTANCRLRFLVLLSILSIAWHSSSVFTLLIIAHKWHRCRPAYITS